MFTLREGTPEDSDELAALFLASRREALPYLPELHTDAETFRWMCDVVLTECRVWVAEEEGPGLAGFLALRGDHVDHLYVLPGRQRLGIGSRLLNAAKQAAPERLRLYTFQRNTAARRFYEERSFAAIKFGDGSDNEECEPDVLYEWKGSTAI